MIRYGYYDVKNPRFIGNDIKSFWVGLGFVTGLILFFIYVATKPAAPVKIISPVPEITTTPTPTPTPTATPTPKPPQKPTKGNASYYSIAGCLGCSPTFTMANGERLDDTKLTFAYNHAPLGTKITIRNTKTGVTVIATVTDRGGFERHGKIADLTIATRDALGCGDTCPIALEW